MNISCSTCGQKRNSTLHVAKRETQLDREEKNRKRTQAGRQRGREEEGRWGKNGKNKSKPNYSISLLMIRFFNGTDRLSSHLWAITPMFFICPNKCSNFINISKL